MGFAWNWTLEICNCLPSIYWKFKMHSLSCLINDRQLFNRFQLVSTTSAFLAVILKTSGLLIFHFPVWSCSNTTNHWFSLAVESNFTQKYSNMKAQIALSYSHFWDSLRSNSWFMSRSIPTSLHKDYKFYNFFTNVWKSGYKQYIKL